MSRDSSGNFTLPAGNPVVTGTTVDSTVHNNTQTDVATELTDSLSRSAKGGMLAVLKVVDGTVSSPGVQFSNDANVGMYRITTDTFGLTAGSTLVLQGEAATVTVPVDLAVTSTTASDLSNSAVAFLVGAVAGQHIEVDPNDIQSKSNATTAASLGLNPLGGSVGVGTSSPNYLTWGRALTVNGAASANAAVELSMNGTAAGYVSYSNTGAAITAVNLYSYAAVPLILGANNTARMRIESNGQISLGAGGAAADVDVTVRGSTADSTKYGLMIINSGSDATFYVRNDGLMNTGTRATSPYNNTTGTAANLVVDATGQLLRSTSSRRYKRDIEDASHGLADLLKLRPVTYRGKAEKDGDRVFGGLIAEEVHDAGLTEFVEYKDAEPDALMYANMVSLCVKAIQELSAKVEQLSARLELV